MPKTPDFSKRLTAWYKVNARDLPWRHTRDPYKIWISEIMLQQTTVAAVIPFYKKWVKTFPRIQDVAKAPLQKVLKAWQGLGYYTRARNIHRSAKIICSQYNGKIPNSYEELQGLPGFGPYTVGAVLSIAFNKRYPIIDANIRRVVMRYLLLKGLAGQQHDKKILSFLEETLPNKEMSTFNQAFMELGALVCRGREPLCNICPVRKTCKAYASGWQELIPEPKKVIVRDVDVAVALIQKKGQYFIQRRPPKGLFAGLWEFPGGKVEKGESPREALHREIREELNIDLKSVRHIMNVRQFYTQFRANLHVWECRPQGNLSSGKDKKWVHLRDLRRYPMPSGSAKILDMLIPS